MTECVVWCHECEDEPRRWRWLCEECAEEHLYKHKRETGHTEVWMQVVPDAQESLTDMIRRARW